MPGRLTPHAELVLAVVTGSAHIFAPRRNLVVGELVQSGAGLIGAIEAVLGFDAADSGHIQQLCILLDLLLGHKNWPDVCFQVEVASTVRLRAYDGVCLVLQTCPNQLLEAAFAERVTTNGNTGNFLD